jgi:PPOX class probable F420-dependent enzyme
VDQQEARRLFSEGRVARMATVGADGAPHLVPIVFAVDGDEILSVVDAKPKRTPELKRLRNLAANPKVSLLVDEYDEEWERLWWVRADGTGRVEKAGPTRDRAIELLWAKYEQYRTAWTEPVGAAVVIQVRRWRWWSLAGPQA